MKTGISPHKREDIDVGGRSTQFSYMDNVLLYLFENGTEIL